MILYLCCHCLDTSDNITDGNQHYCLYPRSIALDFNIIVQIIKPFPIYSFQILFSILKSGHSLPWLLLSHLVSIIVYCSFTGLSLVSHHFLLVNSGILLIVSRYYFLLFLVFHYIVLSTLWHISSKILQHLGRHNITYSVLLSSTVNDLIYHPLFPYGITPLYHIFNSPLNHALFSHPFHNYMTIFSFLWHLFYFWLVWSSHQNSRLWPLLFFSFTNVHSPSLYFCIIFLLS